MKTYNEYLSEYTEKEQTIFVFITTGFGGATMIDSYREVSSYFPAMIDISTNKLVESDGRIEMLVPEDEFKMNSYIRFENNTIYKLIVTKCKPKELAPNVLPSMNNRYFLKSILPFEKGETPKELSDYRNEYLREVNIDICNTHFVLDREFGWFEGYSSMLGYNVVVMLCLDKTSKNCASIAEERYRYVVDNAENLNKKNIARCIDEFLSLANEWKENDSDPDISPEQFAQNLSLSEIQINADKTIEFFYSDNHLFGGHSIMVYLDEDNDITKCDLAG